MKLLVLLSHGTFLSSHNVKAESWVEAKHHIFQWGVYCERLGVKPDKPRIRLYAQMRRLTIGSETTDIIRRSFEGKCL